MTTGIVLVAAFTAAVPGVVWATIRSGFISTNSCAHARNRSTLLEAQRTSIWRFRQLIQPTFFRPCTKASNTDRDFGITFVV